MGFLDYFRKKSITPVSSGGNWMTIVHEPFTGAWQRNQELKRTDLMSYHAVFSCVSLIASDVGKLRFVTKKQKDGVLMPCGSKAQRLLKKPNHYQTWQQFAESWATSKASHGNTYVYIHRDVFGDVWQLYVLNPDRVKPMVSDSGAVFYQISRDKLFNFEHDTIVPASEIIHDRFNCFYHSLVGLSPIVASAVSANHGVAIQSNQTILFGNASRPSGILTTPTPISESKANELRERWQKNYSGLQQGGIAVLGDGVKYEGIAVSSSDAQLLEQLKMTGEIVCSVFHVPAFKAGLGAIPAGQKVGDLNEIYYSDCLQHYIEAIENLLDVHLDLEDGVEIEAELGSLIRMDSTSQMDYLTKGTGSGIISPNEARAKIGLKPVIGGESPLMQQQNYSLEALAKRDNQDDPFNAKQTQTTNQSAKPPSDNDNQSANVDKNAKNAQNAFDSHYQGIFNLETRYQKGVFVTKNGGLWFCKHDCQGDFCYENWQLVSKNGGEK
nr:phage portal protein [uncultured Moraxella sp.]